MKKMLLIVLALILLTIGYIAYDVNVPKVQRISLQSDKIKPGESIHILQISDVHNKMFSEGNKNIVNKVQKLDPDIIVFTGDLIDWKTEDYSNTLAMVKAIIQFNPKVYYVSGNHEWRNPIRDEFLQALKEVQMNIIDNKSEAISIKNMKINVCGVDDPHTHHDSISKALQEVDTGLYTILLAHAPSIIEREQRLPVDLILSGHTHGGQIRMPLIGAIVAPGQGFFPKYDKGVYHINKETTLYIDSGLGTSTLPIRFLNQSQMSFITIHSKN